VSVYPPLYGSASGALQNVSTLTLNGKGITKIAIFAPGFSADCLETLEEVAMEGRETFLEHGGTDFAYLPCLNDTPVGIEMLYALVARELAGWVNPSLD